jgi:autophagy-related protein 18
LDLKYSRLIQFSYYIQRVRNAINKDCGPIGIVEMLFSTNLVLLVGESDSGEFSPRRVCLWHTGNSNIIASSWPFEGRIKMAKITENKMIVLEKTNLYIYSITSMSVIHKIDVGLLTHNKLVISPNNKNNYLCYSSSNEDGLIKVYDLSSLCFKSSIQGHKSEIGKMSINLNGTLLATCSLKGTIIRVFAIPSGDKVATFKRGINPAKIFSINFSFDNQNVISSGDTGTIHIFEIQNENTVYY